MRKYGPKVREAMGWVDGTDWIPSTSVRDAKLIEFGVRIGLDAAAKAADLDLLPVGGERPGYVIRAIDPASVLKSN